MSRGELTRKAILSRALSLASEVGLEGLTIGKLAAQTGLSKSGLFAHFDSKEALQEQVLDFAAARFVENVVRPGLAAAPGEGRLLALFESWLEWPKTDPLPGGCFFVSAATELDDRPGPLRDRLAEMQRRWLGVLSETVRGAVAEGQLRPDVDAEQFAHDVYGVMLAYHHAARLLRDPRAKARARSGVSALLAAARRTAIQPAGPGVPATTADGTAEGEIPARAVGEPPCRGIRSPRPRQAETPARAGFP